MKYMLSFGGRNRVVNIAIEDYAIRMVENNGKDLSSIKTIQKKRIPQNIIKRGKIVDELAFFEFMKKVVSEWKIKNRKVRFYAPHDLVILRNVNIPEDVARHEIEQHITMEIGHTIHFPFTHPIFNLYDVPETPDVKEVTVIAASEEEIIKYVNVFDDVNLEPVAVDVHALGTYRYAYLTEPDRFTEDVYLFIEFNLTAVNISIFHNHKLEFLRYQPLNISNKDWELDSEDQSSWVFTGDEIHLEAEINDQVNELSRLMSFYQFTLHQGNKSVNKIFLHGDHPYLPKIKELLETRYELPIEKIKPKVGEKEIDIEYVPLLGLALKGVK